MVRLCALSLFAVLATLVACDSTRAPKRLGDGSDPPNTPCDASRVCKVWGWCAEENGECVASTDDHCRASEACKKGGLCSRDGAKCVAKNDDCERSDWCENHDLCEAREGVCK